MPKADVPVTPASLRSEAGPFVALAALGAWTIIVPYVGRAVGLDLNVAARLEVVDHVVPGTLVAAIGVYLIVVQHRKGRSDWSRMIGGGMAFLAGFWVLATHVSLLSEAVQGTAPWGATLWHASTAIPLVALSLWIVLRAA